MADKSTKWEGSVTGALAETLGVSYADASAVSEGQPFYMQQSWGKGMNAQQTTAKILAAAQGEELKINSESAA